MTQDIVVIGGGYAFWEIIELIKDINAVQLRYKVIGVLDDSEILTGQELGGIKVLGNTAMAKELPNSIKFIFGIGSFRTRLLRPGILQKIGVSYDRFETLIHPSAKVFSTASIGRGCIIHFGSVVFHNSIIDDFSIISANCVIAVENRLGWGALLGSSITTTTGVKIGSFSFIGSGTNIGEHVEIEPGAQIGMGSLILKPVKKGTFVLGNPPRVLDKVEVPDEIMEAWNQFKTK